MLTGEKSALSSKTIRTCLVGLIAFLGTIGVKWAVSDQDIEVICEALMVLIPLVTLPLAAWFRKTATSRIAPSFLPILVSLVHLSLAMAILGGSVGCSSSTSGAYKRVVHRTYPIVADRIVALTSSPLHPSHTTDFPLPPHRQRLVTDLIVASSPADPKAVDYAVARPAWEAASEYYRSLVRTAPPTLLPPFSQQNYLDTADILDEAQAAEAEYQATQAQPIIPPLPERSAPPSYSPSLPGG